MPGRKRPTQVETVYARLKREILDNRLTPGSMASEPELAQRLDVSRTPVREALVRLQGEGLVDLIPRRGIRVLPISPKDMQDIYEILILLEPEVAADAARGPADPDTIAALEAATSEMEQALAGNDLDAWAKADDRFHRDLLVESGNRRMAEFIGTLFDQAHRARMVTLKLRDPPTQSTQDHRRILQAIKAGNADEARDLFRAHRRHAAQELMGILVKTSLNSL